MLLVLVLLAVSSVSVSSVSIINSVSVGSVSVSSGSVCVSGSVSSVRVSSVVCNTLIEIRKIWFTRYISFEGVSFATKGKSGTFKLYMTKSNTFR